MRFATTAVTATMVLVCSSVASAQTPAHPGAATAPATTPADPATSSATPEPAAAPAATPASVVTSPPREVNDDADRARFRFAVHVLGGPWLLPDKMGGAGGVGVQLGVQINDNVGVYYSGTAGIGAAYGTAGAFAYNAVVPELTLGNILQVGLGPSLDSFAFGSVNVSQAGASATAIGGTFFGVQGRVGIAVGSSRPGKKGRFMLGAEVHPTFLAGIVPTTLFLTIGGGSF